MLQFILATLTEDNCNITIYNVTIILYWQLTLIALAAPSQF